MPKAALIEKGVSEEVVNAGLEMYSAKGCDKCTKGYKGRVGIYEVMKIVPEISRIIMADGNALEIADASTRNGFKNIFESALVKVQHGMTSMAEIDRVTSGGH